MEELKKLCGGRDTICRAVVVNLSASSSPCGAVRTMPKIVECVPNFSEGRDKTVINAIADAIKKTEGVILLDVDPGPSTNRTVYTFVGSPEAVVQGALNAAVEAYKRIDMTKHKGEHPRLGAMDVCPFVPVSGVEVEECIYCAHQLSKSLSSALGVPIFLYGAAADRKLRPADGTPSYRETVPQIRAGEYEGLYEKLTDPRWKPDYGPAEFIPRWGATMVGVRKFLIAYNINILSTKEQAHRIALNIREQGRGKSQPGRLRCVQGIGWWLDEANMAQISLNLIDHEVTPMHVAFEEVCKDAKELKLGVVGSEVVGLVPLSALLAAADFYAEKEGLFVLEEEQRVRLAIDRMGLSSLHPFDPKKRIIEYRLPGGGKGERPLLSLTAENFVQSVAARTPAPGGGSVSALVGALGAALATMVGQMTFGKKQWENLDSTMRKLIPKFYKAMNDILPLVDADTTAFNDYMEAMKLPKNTEEEVHLRNSAMQAALQQAISVPLSLAETINTVWEPAIELAKVSNIQTTSDLQVGVRCMETGVWGAYYNAKINLGGLNDPQCRDKLNQQAQKAVATARAGCKAVLDILESREIQ
ncbi:hypothetical protein J437_LFUL005329 [Ladona fulva]|uniref:Formimidoyltransferase-cyclodeaminase n=1 Tax=Ladona fulva TaxID=123851 RepID=A0A8K0JZS3_LADFU|nr:hypothetical protein J437_LFUL005329 [Ladona fulva]